jgi:spermidine synthase
MRAERVFLYLTVFMCGAAVLVIELISARHLSPFYGTSLAVWTAVISVTLAALAVGYAVGGWLGDRMVARNRGLFGLACILFAAAAGSGLLPVAGPRIMLVMRGLGLLGGVLGSTALMLFPALGALGMVGPYCIRLFSRDVEHVGRVAGQVFAISTFGSILAAMATGFYLAPMLGVRGSYLLVAGVLAVLTIVAIVLSRRIGLAVVTTSVLALLLIPAALSLHRPVPVTLGEYRILQSVEGGPSGEVKIAERESANGRHRVLMFDGLFQTGVYLDTGASIFPYAHVIAAGLSALEPGSHIVVVGVGGGILPTLLSNMGYQVTGVDIDPRMPALASQWFNMPDSVRIVIGDGRQFIQDLAPASVDAIVLDAFTGDREPVHLMTLEFIEACKRAVKPNGMIVVNPLMYTNGERGRCYAGLIRTLRQAGLEPQAVGTEPNEEWRNILVFAHPDRSPWKKGFRREPLLKLGLDLGSIVLRDFSLALINPVEPAAIDNVPLFTDDRTALDYLNQGWNHGLRRVMIDEVTPEVIFY